MAFDFLKLRASVADFGSRLYEIRSQIEETKRKIEDVEYKYPHRDEILEIAEQWFLKNENVFLKYFQERFLIPFVDQMDSLFPDDGVFVKPQYAAIFPDRDGSLLIAAALGKEGFMRIFKTSLSRMPPDRFGLKKDDRISELSKLREKLHGLQKEEGDMLSSAAAAGFSLIGVENA